MTEQYFDQVSSTFPAFDFTEGQVAILKACVDGTKPPAEAAWEITRYVEMASSPIEMNQRLGGLWTLFSDAAVHMPQAQTQMISLMQEIQKLPRGPEPEGEGKDHFDLDDGFYWRELTGWGSLWADDVNSYASQYLISTRPASNTRAPAKAKWTNACAFIARLTIISDGPLALLGEGLNMATIAIREALETDSNGKEPPSLDAAAQLFKYASPELYRRCKDEMKTAFTRNGELWNGSKGYSLQRWIFWHDRWKSIAKDQTLSVEVQETAQGALKDMHRAQDHVR